MVRRPSQNEHLHERKKIISNKFRFESASRTRKEKEKKIIKETINPDGKGRIRIEINKEINFWKS